MPKLRFRATSGPPREDIELNKQRLIIPIVLMFVVLMFVMLPGAAPDQTLPKVYRLGLLGCGLPPSDTGDIVAGLIRGLAQRGYVLDRNVAFERRGAQFHLDRLPELVGELVASRVDVIVAIGYPAAAAAQQGTKTIPIVSAGTPDAIATGLVNSLSRPGGNLTGISDDAVARTLCQASGVAEGGGAPAASCGDAI
jgi:ABC-type uncharacterized transport system substrate-binding protein